MVIQKGSEMYVGNQVNYQVYGNRTLTATKFICWKPPEREWIKLNLDGGVYKGSGVATCGGMLRDSSGVWRSGFMKNIGCCSV